MRKTLRAFALMLALTLLVSGAALGEASYPVAGGADVTLTYAKISMPQISSQYDSFQDTPLLKAWTERTGINVKVIETSDDTSMNLLFASGDLPDMVSWTWGSYAGGVAKAISDGIVRPINDLIDEYAPDYKAVLAQNDDFQRGTKTAAGDIAGFNFLRGSNYLCVYGGPIVRADWLKKCGLENPRTVSDFYNMLLAFRDQCGAEYPLSINAANLAGASSSSWLLGAFGLASADFFHDGETVRYGYYTEELKDAYAFLHQLYEEGLLDPDFATMDGNTHRSNLYNGKGGFSVGNVGGGIGTYMNAMKDDPEFDVLAMNYLVADDAPSDAKPISGFSEFPATSSIVCITTACEHPELAAQFLNYGYTDEGRMLMNFGIEGESYNMIDGYPTYTEDILNNAEGISIQYRLAAYTFAWYMGPTVQADEYMEQYSSLPQQQEAIRIWMDTDILDYRMPSVTIPDGTSARYVNLMTDIGTYVSEMRIKFITGEESLDNYDAYLAQLTAMGVEEMIAIQQAAYDEYMSR